MKKIPTIFSRDFTVKGNPLTTAIKPECQWVFDGEGVATKKLDGTCCMVKDGELWRRYETKGEWPDDCILVEADPATGKLHGWKRVGSGPDDKYHREAFTGRETDGTYELIGPKVQGNPERSSAHVLVSHASEDLLLLGVNDPPREFNALKTWLSDRDMEGIVWHHPDGRMAKIKKRDFGLFRARDTKKED